MATYPTAATCETNLPALPNHEMSSELPVRTSYGKGCTLWSWGSGMLVAHARGQEGCDGVGLGVLRLERED